MDTTRIVRTIDKVEWNNILIQCKKCITLSPHARDRLNDAQRKFFTEEELRKIIIREVPILVGIQHNGRYALFYRRSRGFTKIICANVAHSLEIITFINLDQLPNLQEDVSW